MYFYILSSDVKSPWNYNLAFFDILLTTLSNACVLNIRSYVFFDLSFDCLSIFFFFHLIILASSLRVLINRALYGDKFWFFICSFYFSLLLPSDSRIQLYLLSEKKCILISTATALLFTLAWFLSFDIPDEWYYCWETVKKQDLFSDTIRNERYTLK